METSGSRRNILETTVSYRAWVRLTPTLTHVVTYKLVTSGAEMERCHTLNTHINLPSIARPRHLIRSPSNLARIPSICGTTHPQQIRAQRRPDPPQSHQNCLGQFQGSQGARGHPRLKQTTPLTGLSAPKLPLPRRRVPNVARCVARPRRGHTVIGRQRQIGRLENPQNW